jgi:hypothetical protein
MVPHRRAFLVTIQEEHLQKGKSSFDYLKDCKTHLQYLITGPDPEEDMMM